MGVQIRNLLPGLVAAGAVGAAALGLAGLIRAAPPELPVSAALLAILAGLLLAGAAGRRPHWQPGLGKAAGPLLKLGVMLIGLRLSLADIGALGLQALAPALAVIVLALLAMALLARLAGIPHRLAALLGVGTAICGASAIAATAPGLQARAEETGYAVACVALFGVAATLTWPWVFHPLLEDPRLVGIALGASIHDTAQVTGAAMLYDEIHASHEALEAATVTKLLRNAAMLVVVPVVVAWMMRGEAEGGGGFPKLPLFILGFLGFAGLRSLGDLGFGDSAPVWEQMLGAASWLSNGLIAVALAAMGMGIRLGGLRALGWRPAAAALACALGIAAAAVAGLRLFYA